MTRNLLLLMISTLSCFAQVSLVSSVGNFIHDVGDLDQSVHFYRDVVGMELQRPPSDWQTTEGVMKMYDAVGAKFRATNAQIPDSPMRVELVQFQGVVNNPVKRMWGAAGTSVLILTVTDLDRIAERVKTDGAAVAAKMTKACDGRGMVVTDPDGFSVMLVEHPAQAVVSKGPGPVLSHLSGLRFGYVVSSDAMAKGPFAALGLKAEARKHVCQPIEEALMRDAAEVVTLPGGFEVWLFKGKASNGAHAMVRPRDPGAAVLRLMVTDVDAAVAALGRAQTKVVSVGGEPVTLSPTLRAAITRGPDDLLIQVVK